MPYVAEAKSELFKALGHPARIRVLEILAGGEHTVGELAAGTGLELSHLSQQVTVLRRAGVVESRRVKNTVVCSIRSPLIADLLQVARRLITENLRESRELLAELEGDLDGSPVRAGGE